MTIVEQGDAVTYVFGVVRAASAGAPEPRLTGVDGGPVRVIVDGPVGALAQSVPARDFDEAALREHLEDLAWLERVARAHHGVVEAAANRGAVLPFRLTTVFLDDERVKGMLRERAEVFLARFHLLAGCREWGVKVYTLDGATASAPATPAPAAALGRPGSGRAYLRQRRGERDVREERWRTADEVSRRLEAELRTLARGHRRYPAQREAVAQAPVGNVYNAAFLVPDADARRLTEIVRAANEVRDVRVELTGPWAPYSFAEASA